jgi:hypothetical protein
MLLAKSDTQSRQGRIRYEPVANANAGMERLGQGAWS